MTLFGINFDRRFMLTLAATGGVAASLVLVNFLYLQGDVTLFTTINAMAAFVFAAPLLIKLYTIYKRKKDLEEKFPVFLRDFVEAIRGGMPLPQAFSSIANNDYGALTPYVKKIAAQLEWGIPVDKVLLGFSKQTKSKVIGRVVSSVVESHRYGGNFADTFEALSNTAVEVDRLRAERRLFLQSQMITGYIIFFVFLAVIIGLEKFLVPSLTQSVPIGLTASVPQEQLAQEYRAIFRNLILIQGLFAGLSVGKMAEGALIAGLKHSFIMMLIGSIVFLVIG